VVQVFYLNIPVKVSFYLFKASSFVGTILEMVQSMPVFQAWSLAFTASYFGLLLSLQVERTERQVPEGFQCVLKVHGLSNK
jgi:hypothetical protein